MENLHNNMLDRGAQFNKTKTSSSPKVDGFVSLSPEASCSVLTLLNMISFSFPGQGFSEAELDRGVHLGSDIAKQLTPHCKHKNYRNASSKIKNMEITKFVITGRDQALLYGDYSTYRNQLSRQLLSIRKKLGRTTKKGAKYASKAPVTAQDIANNSG